MDRYETGPVEVEASLLRSDLNNIFIDNKEQVEVYIPNDYDLPAEYVLAGNYNFKRVYRLGIIICQRIDVKGTNYLMMCEEITYNSFSWCLINDVEAKVVWNKMPDMKYEDITIIRDRIKPENIIWDKNNAINYLNQRSYSPFETVDSSSTD